MFKQGDFPQDKEGGGYSDFWTMSEDAGRFKTGFIAVPIRGFLYEKQIEDKDLSNIDGISDFMLTNEEAKVCVPYIHVDPLVKIQQELERLVTENAQMKLSFNQSLQGVNKRLQTMEYTVKHMRDANTRLMGGGPNG